MSSAFQDTPDSEGRRLPTDGQPETHAGGAQGLAALLLLADGRFPAGGYAHSGGLEPMVANGRVHDVDSLESFLRGRAATSGLVAAGIAAAACGAVLDLDAERLTLLDDALDARMPSPAQRSTSRQLGRQLLRVMHMIRPDPRFDGLGRTPHHPVVLGVTAATFGLGRRDAAMLSLHECIAGPAAAAVRLLSIDPFETHASLARLGPYLESLADEAAAASHEDVDNLSAAGSPLMDLAAEQQTWHEKRLFAS
ncbi:MAG: urease accessory UreF family protein [Knoellia sp.]